MNMLIKTWMCTVYLFSALAFGREGWVSSGGELIGHGGNPWFLDNTREVSYCVRGDQRHLSLDMQRVRDIVREVISYWKAEFESASSPIIGRVPLRVASQNFMERSCTAGIQNDLETFDLVIQLGELNEEQRSHLGDPTKFVGVSVLTDYDPVALRGKGFLYISADSGPLRYKRTDLVDSAWSIANGELLRNVMAHEFGHLFGLPHRGLGRLDQIMGAGYPEATLLREFVGFFRNTPLPKVFSSTSDPSRELIDPASCIEDRLSFLTFFELNFPNGKCRRLTVSDSGILIEAVTTEGAVLGARQMTLYPGEEVKTEDFGRVFISREQNVFSNIEPIFYGFGYLPGPRVKSILKKGFVVLPSGIRRELVARISPGGIDLSGVVDGVYQTNFSNDPWPR